MALTPIVMKYFERLVMGHIKNSLPTSLAPPHQFANRSTEDTISSTIYAVLSYMDNKKNTCSNAIY